MPLHKGILITGSSGFIGTHVCRALSAAHPEEALSGLDIVRPRAACGLRFLHVDIRKPADLRRHVAPLHPHTVVHLAAVAEVLIPFAEIPPLLDTNVTGTLNILQELKPKLVLFASTSAVYGNAPAAGAPPTWDEVSPVGIYGMSKAVSEMIGRDWARETGGVFLHFRFGNVIGRNCRGLIPYLVRHAKRHPDGSPPAQLRGQGRLVRDYVPVDYVIQLFEAAMAARWSPGTSATLNVGTGRGTTNRSVARIVQGILRRRGYKLSLDFNHPIGPGESQTVVLDMKSTARRLGLRPPSRSVVIQAIEDATLSFLDKSSQE